jgi:hypothetical protein
VRGLVPAVQSSAGGWTSDLFSAGPSSRGRLLNSRNKLARSQSSSISSISSSIPKSGHEPFHATNLGVFPRIAQRDELPRKLALGLPLTNCHLSVLKPRPRNCKQPGNNDETACAHGMRNEMSHSKEVALDRSLLHPWLRGGASPRSSTNNGRREAGFVIKRHTILALLIHERDMALR